MRVKAATTFCIALILAVVGTAFAEPAVQLVETFPVETTLDHPAIPEAYEVWIEMIDGAESTLDFAEFYASNEPDSRLEGVIAAVERAAGRGVGVRFLAEKKFHEVYPETLDRLSALDGVDLRIFDVKAVMGGVLHAKYFLVDRDQAYIGSQNFDWRSLTHIQELGVRVRDEAAVATLGKVFDMDWKLAAGEIEATPSRLEPPGPVVSGDDENRVAVVASPRDWLPEGVAWDLPALVDMIDGATETVRLQLLTYKTVGWDKSYFDDLESALRRGAARGVTVQLLLADWCKRKGTIEGLQSLEVVPGIDVKLVTIPEWSGGFIPYARVVHAKYLVVDGAKAWVGTSNWEKSYFYDSRNVGVILEGSICDRLDDFFETGWNAPYAAQVEPCAVYEAPRIGE